ncbi:MAG TPA: PAS domain S-box protein [Candidatus Hydrogenedens sp.]|nr:PAS domain S-box protein [Candidatus Hydrogenedens sp.]
MLQKQIKNIKNLFNLWITESVPEDISNEPNIQIISSIESLSLFLRYLTLIVVIVGYSIESFSQQYFVSIFLGCIIFHILFTHIVFYLKQYYLFTNPLNFFLHLLTITTSVVVTEKEYSPLILFYPLLTFGNLIYARKRPRPLMVTLISIITLNFTIIGIWLWENLAFATYYLFWKNFMILLSGIFCYFLLNYIQQIRRESYHIQQELLYTQGIIKSILDSIQSPILIFDESEIITDTNSYTSQFFQMDSSELIGQRIRSLFFDDTLIGEHLLALRSRSNVVINAIALSSSGEEIPVDFIVQVFYRNQRKYFFGIMIDKREHKRLEEISQLLHKREEEINNKISLLKDLQSDLSLQHTAQIFTYITTLKNILHLLSHEQLGVITERQKNALEIGIHALEQLENELQKEAKIVS